MPVLWDAEELAIADNDDCARKFFVRADLSERGAVLNSFTGITEIHTDDIDFGFITDVMTEKEFNDRIKGLKKVLSVIRVDET